MDGATKYKGDAVAGLIITVINIAGGIITGMMNHGLTAAEALRSIPYTIGDGLVAQIPSLMISLSTGILVTKVSKEADFGNLLVEQLFSIPKVLYIVGTSMIILNCNTAEPLSVYRLWSCLYSVGQKHCRESWR